MDEITTVHITEIETESDSDTLVLHLSDGTKVGIHLMEYLSSVLKKNLIKKVTPTNDAEPFIIINGKGFNTWDY